MTTTGAAPAVAPRTGQTPESPGLRVRRAASFFVLYLLTVHLGYAISAGGVIAPIWPPAGVAVAGLFLLGSKMAWLVALGTVLGQLRQLDLSPLAVAAVAAVNATEALLGAALLRRAKFSPALARTRDVVALALVAGLAPLVAVPVAIAVGSQLGYSGEILLRGVTNWWSGNTLSILVVSSALFVLSAKRERIERQPAMLERVALAALVIAVSFATFLLGPVWGLREIACAFVLFQFVVWAALRHERAAVVGVNVAVAAVATCALVISWQVAADPIAVLAQSIRHASTVSGGDYLLFANRILLLEGYVAAVAIAGLLISAVMSERRSAERELQKSERRFRAVTEEAFDAFALFRPERTADGALRDLVFEELNRRGRSLLGIGRVDPIGLGFADLFPTAANGRFLTLCGTLLENHRVFEGEFDTGALGGPGRRIIRLLIVPVGRRLAVTARDVTDARQAEEQLRQTLKMEAVGRLAGGVAHDFNNMMTAISGYAELALAALSSDHPVREELEQIQRASERTAFLTRQLLALGRRQVMRRDSVDPNAIIADTMRLLRPLLGPDLNVVLDLASDLGRVLSDAGQLQQVVMNLALNARDAMSSGGTLRIATKNVEIAAGEAHVAVSSRSGPHVEVSVEDDGCGMDEATLRQAFDPFFTTRAASGGTGLGLSIVYGIVQQSDGHVVTRSVPGEGTTFRLRFPRYDGAHGARIREPVVVSSGSGECVLVVEDEDSIRSLICRALGSAGYRVLEANNGSKALELVARHPGEIRVLVTDVVMPGMNGHELARRARSWRSGLRVLFVSGYDEESALRGEPVDVDTRFLAKPFTTREMLERVRELLDGVPATDSGPTSPPAG